MFRKGQWVKVLEVHPADGTPYVKVGDVVNLDADTYPYEGDFTCVYAHGGVTWARVELSDEGGIERVRGMLVENHEGADEVVPVDMAAAAAVDVASKYDDAPTIPPPPFMSTDSATRKLMPVASGVLKYFPDAQMLKAWISRVGNDKHNPGQPLHWDKSKSADEPDAEVRHMLDHFRSVPPDPGLEALAHLGHLASKAWRADADLQRACDEARAAYERGEDWRK
jgi:hypothetical protein